MRKPLNLLIFMISLSSCVAEKPPGSQDNTDIKEEISLLSSELCFSERQQTAILEFDSTVDWSIELINDRASGWCSVKPSSGEAGSVSVIVSVNENTDYDDRQAVLLIKAGQCSETVVVSQKQKDALTVTSSRFEVSSNGGTVDIEVKSNVDFEYYTTDSAQEWLHDMQPKSLETHHLSFSIDENHETRPRNATVYIVNGNLMETVNIYQDGVTPCIVISDKEHWVESVGGTVTVEVSSNVDVVVELPADVDWISESVTRASSTNMYSFDVMPNTSYDSRTAEIKFSNAESGLCEIISIIQAEYGAFIYPGGILDKSGITSSSDLQPGKYTFYLAPFTASDSIYLYFFWEKEGKSFAELRFWLNTSFAPMKTELSCMPYSTDINKWRNNLLVPFDNTKQVKIAMDISESAPDAEGNTWIYSEWWLNDKLIAKETSDGISDKGDLTDDWKVPFSDIRELKCFFRLWAHTGVGKLDKWTYTPSMDKSF